MTALSKLSHHLRAFRPREEPKGRRAWRRTPSRLLPWDPGWSSWPGRWRRKVLLHGQPADIAGRQWPRQDPGLASEGGLGRGEEDPSAGVSGRGILIPGIAHSGRPLAARRGL